MSYCATAAFGIITLHANATFVSCFAAACNACLWVTRRLRPFFEKSYTTQTTISEEWSSLLGSYLLLAGQKSFQGIRTLLLVFQWNHLHLNVSPILHRLCSQGNTTTVLSKVHTSQPIMAQELKNTIVASCRDVTGKCASKRVKVNQGLWRRTYQKRTRNRNTTSDLWQEKAA